MTYEAPPPPGRGRRSWMVVTYVGVPSAFAHSFSLDPDTIEGQRAETACGKRPMTMPQYPDALLLGFAPATEEVPRCPACRHALSPSEAAA